MNQRFRSILVGTVIGAFLAFWVYTFEGMMLAYGPHYNQMGRSALIPQELINHFFFDCFKFSIIPGAIIGFIGGSTFPLLSPRGHLSKSLGALLYFLISPTVWITQRDNFSAAGKGNISMAIFITIVLFLAILPVSNMFGSWVEKFRE